MIFLRFPDEATARALMAEYISDDGEWITDSHTHSLDPLGIIHRPINELETAPLSGWHINFLGDLPATASEYVVTPANPVRLFAGVNL